MEWICDGDDSEETVEQNSSSKTGHTVTAVGHRDYVFGGYNHGESHDLIFSRNTGKWEVVSKDVGVSVEHHTAHLVDDRILLVAGDQAYAGEEEEEQEDRACVYEYSVLDNTMARRYGYGDVPVRFLRHVSEYFEWRREVVVFGGKRCVDMEFTNQLYSIDVDTLEWVELRAKGVKPEPQSSHMSCASKQKMFIFVTYDYPELFDLYVLDLKYPTAVWSSLRKKGAVPRGIYGGSMEFIGGFAIIFGGLIAQQYQDTLYVCDVKRELWYRGVKDGEQGLANTFVVNGQRWPGSGARHVGVVTCGKIRYYGGLQQRIDEVLELIVDETLIERAIHLT